MQQLAGRHQPDMPAFVPEMLATFDLHNIRRLQITHALNVRQRKGIGLVANLHHQAAHHRQGQRHFKMETTALARRLLQHHRTAQLPDHVLHRIQADATTGHLGDPVAQAETGQEQERQQLFFAQLRGGFCGGQISFNDTATDFFQIHAITVIAQFKHQQTSLMRSAQTNQTFRRLAGQQALFREFDAVVDRVAQQVSQRRLELFQHVAIDLGLLAFNFQSHLFTQVAPQITDHAHLPGQHIGKGPHATGQRRVVQHLRPLAGMPGELVEFGVLFHEQLLGLREQAPRILKGFLGLQAQGVILEMHIEVLQCAQAVALHALESLHGRQVRFEPQGFHQGFARQIEQAVQALGGDTQHTFAVFGGAFGLVWSWRRWRFDDRRRRLDLRRGCFELKFGHHRCGRRNQRGRRVQQPRHQRHIGLDVRDFRVVARCGDAHQQIGALQQRIDMLGAQQQAAFLGADQTIFHHMGDADSGVDTDDPRRTLERVRGTHARFKLIGLGRVALKRQQAGAQDLGLGFGLQAEQLQQRGVAHLLGGHVRLRVTADSSCSSSSQRRLRPLNCNTPRVYLALA
ncbi:hypothetical protein D3C76_668870 [compost metagenome]